MSAWIRLQRRAGLLAACGPCSLPPPIRLQRETRIALEQSALGNTADQHAQCKQKYNNHQHVRFAFHEMSFSNYSIFQLIKFYISQAQVENRANVLKANTIIGL